jgi:hypothetical protein
MLPSPFRNSDHIALFGGAVVGLLAGIAVFVMWWAAALP